MIEDRLLSCLQKHANARGIVPIREDVLLQEVGATRETVGLALDKFELAGLIRILSPFPFLVLKLKKWPGSAPNVGDSSTRAYSYSKLSNHVSVEQSYRQAGDSSLMAEILETLGETDPTSFEGAIRNYPADVIRKALDRVRRTQSLRKNRTALFRFLLTKIS